MPRIKFGNIKDFKKWMRVITTNRKYSLYVCLKSVEIVAVPLVSTDPVNYGRLLFGDVQSAKKIAEELCGELSMPLFMVDSLEFSDEPKP